MTKEGTVSKLCTRTNNVKPQSMEELLDVRYVYYNFFLLLLNVSRVKEMSLIIAIA